MTSEQRRYLFVQTAIGAAVVNAALNALIGWGATHGLTQFPVWQLPGVAADIVATAFGVSFGTCLAAQFQAKWDVAKGKVTVPAPPPSLAGLLERLPATPLKRGIWLGVWSVPVFVPPVIAALLVAHLHALDRNTFVTLKATFSAVEGGIVTPIIVLAALLDLSKSPGVR
jgi:hypothetical protein